jgi:hypothetical protein
MLSVRTYRQMRVFEGRWEGTELSNTELDDTSEEI